MEISNNDLKLIKYLFECRFLTRKQIKEYVLKNMNNSYIDDRIPQLKKNHFIKYFKNPLVFSDEKYVYGASNYFENSLLIRENIERFKKMCDDLNLYYIPVENYKSFNNLDFRRTYKQYYLNNARFILEEIGAKSWLPYYIIKNKSMRNKIKNKDKKKFNIYPDGIMRSERRLKKNKVIAIDLYNNTSNVSFRDKIKKYSQEKSFDIVLFVTYGEQSKNIYNSLQKKITPKYMRKIIYKKEIKTDFFTKFFVITYKDLINGKFEIFNKHMNKGYDLKKIL